jgi:ElaB/YqjD/DUF883 family membrane-anchored ribosome-binding protein
LTKASEDMMSLTSQEAEIFERRLAMARKQLEEIDQEIERELEAVKERIEALREKRKASLKVYDAACTMLGKENDLAGEDR